MLYDGTVPAPIDGDAGKVRLTSVALFSTDIDVVESHATEIKLKFNKESDSEFMN